MFISPIQELYINQVISVAKRLQKQCREKLRRRYRIQCLECIVSAKSRETAFQTISPESPVTAGHRSTMNARTSTYIPFLSLSSKWAGVSGVPKEMVLRRICEWSVSGAFPDGAFVTASGVQIPPLDIYMSFLAIEASRDGGHPIHLDGYTYYDNGRLGLQLLEKVLVIHEHVSEFCNRINTIPPPPLLSGFRRLWVLRSRRKHLVPPPCTDGPVHAARLAAHNGAIGHLNALRSMLSGLQGKPTMFGPRRAKNETVDFDFWEPRWKAAREHSQNDIRRSGDVGLQEELNALDAAWASFMTNEVESRTRSTTSSIETSQPVSPRHAVETRSNKRGGGRPRGAGSYSAVDALLVEEMRAAILNDVSLSPTAAAFRLIDRAAGAGTDESRAKRLVERYSEKYGR